MHDLEHGTETVFERNAQRPVWSGDGAYIAFWKRDGQVYRKPVNGTGQEEPLGPKAAVRFLSDWSSDGRYLIEETRPDAKTGRDIWVVPLFGDKTPYPLLHSEADEFGAALTPNGRWLAYVSNESKRNEIYVVSFPNSGKPMEISTGGGDRPVWSRDGEELYFIGPGQKMMAVEIQSSPTFDYSVPKPLFDAKVGGALFDVARNGRFLISAGAARGAAAMHVTINWPTELKK